MALPDTYSQLYPGRFLKADLFKGAKVTLTIKNIDIEELIGENNKKSPKVIVSFTERPLEYVMPKTCGECLRRMFGNNPRTWIGKRVTWFPTQCKFGREDVDCIRVWGSPDIAEDMQITVNQGRKKPIEMVMHKVLPGTCGFKGEAIHGPAPVSTTTEPSVAVDPRISAAWGILSILPAIGQEDLRENFAGNQSEYLTDLNRRIDLQAEA